MLLVPLMKYENKEGDKEAGQQRGLSSRVGHLLFIHQTCFIYLPFKIPNKVKYAMTFLAFGLFHRHPHKESGIIMIYIK